MTGRGGDGRRRSEQVKKKTAKSEEKTLAAVAPGGKIVGPGVIKRPKPPPGEPKADAPGTPTYAPSEQVFRRRR